MCGMMANLAVKLGQAIPRRYYNDVQDVFFMVRSLRYAGGEKVCPCCGWHLRDFIRTRGAHTTRLVPACPRCHAIERHRWMWLYLQEHTDILMAQTRLLHFAPEFCFYRLFRRMANVHMIGTDLRDNGRIGLFQDITQLAFPDAAFDAVICNHVLEHVPDDRRAMAELYRVLQPGGWAVINVPVRMDQLTYEDFSITTPAAREQHFGQSDHVRWYGYDFVDRLSAAGFNVRVELARDLDPETVDRYGLDPDGIMFFCTKSSSPA